MEFLLIVSTGVKFGFFKNNLKFRFARKLYQEIGPGKCTTRMWKDEFLVIVIRLCFFIFNFKVPESEAVKAIELLSSLQVLKD